MVQVLLSGDLKPMGQASLTFPVGTAKVWGVGLAIRGGGSGYNETYSI